MDAILSQHRSAISSPAEDLAAEANHRIANSLTLLVSMVRIQARRLRHSSGPLSPADVRLMLEGIAARISTISQLHRLLSRVDGDGATNIKPHLKDVTDALVAALSSPDQQVRVCHSGHDCMVPTRHVRPIVLILCEIFINAMKYAHPAGVPLLISIDCRAGGDGRLILQIGDDGVGLPENFDLVTAGGLGFRVMRGLATGMGADFAIHSSNLGLCFRLAVPAAGMASEMLA